jgi:hypothetical protein
MISDLRFFFQSNQEYLVNRIKELAKGSCLANYKWDSGSNETDEHTPVDSAILFHLFCVYFDSQLYRSPDYGRPFYDRCVMQIDNKKTSKEILGSVKIKNKAKCAILVNNPLKPKFNFISRKFIISLTTETTFSMLSYSF